MKIYLISLILFLLAFSGLAAGLLLKRRGLRGGCGSTAIDGGKCQCKEEGITSRQRDCDA